MVYGTVYTVPKEIGMVDISTFGAILLHVRDPFLALQNALRLTRETVIITDSYEDFRNRFLSVLRLSPELVDRHPILLRGLRRRAEMQFVPTPQAPGYADTWWNISPESLRRMITVLGFEKISISYHWQKYGNKKVRLYTLVGHRTQDYYNY